MASATTTQRSDRTIDLDRPTNKVVPALLLIVFWIALIGVVSWLVWYIVNLATSAEQETRFIFRRFEEPVKVRGREFDPAWFWPPILIPVLFFALVYVIWMYVRDSRSVGWLWATFLASLRCTVYVLLALIFLLPALQTWEKIEARSKVLLLIDLSGSMGISDEQASEVISADKLETRLDKVARFLTNEQQAFIKNLQTNNPVTVYGFGGRLDEDFRVLPSDKRWTRAEWDAWMKLDLRQWVLDELSDEGKETLRNTASFDSGKPMPSTEWASAWRKLSDDEAIPSGLSDEDKAKLKAKRDKLDKKIELRAQIINGTNLGDSLLAAYNREANNMLAGIIVISDGRSHQGSDLAYEELKTRARKAKVPLFTVGVGEDRPTININITDLQAPEQTPPDDKFPVRVEVDGPGLADQELEVTLDAYRPNTDPKKDKPDFNLAGKFKLKPGEPPHGTYEFQFDPADEQFARMRKADTPKPEFMEGEWTFVARIPRDKREAFKDKEHVSDAATVNIIKKPLRVLLFAGGPTRDYQFARTLFVRESDRKRAELSIYLQVGQAGERVQDVDPNRLLRQFPYFLRVEDDPNEKAEDRYYNLAQYDLIIAFDPDWTQLEPQQLDLLRKWVDTQAGGLIVIGGPVNSFQLARGVNFDKLKPILDLYPVSLEDSRLQGLAGVGRPTTEPWRLNFVSANAETDYLKLDDESKTPLAGWEEFFKGEGTPNGFYNFYPVKSVKAGAAVVATFSDPRARLADGKEQPFLVSMKYGKGSIFYIGSGEMWRLRTVKGGEAYHERFWTKLGRYVSSGTLTRMTRRGVLVMGRQFIAGNPLRLEAQLFGPDLAPLPQNSKPPRVKLTPPPGVTLANPTFTLQPKPSQGEWNGWFMGRHLVTTPGEYRLDLEIPGSPDSLTGKFVVKEANPELDNTRPDFGQLYQVATELNDLGVNDQVKAKVKQRLRPPRLDDKGKADSRESAANLIDKDSPRMFFDLKTAELIPECILYDSKTQRSRGPVDDLWDDGPTVQPEYADLTAKVVAGAYVLMLAGLLCAPAIILFLNRRPLHGVVALVTGLVVTLAIVLFVVESQGTALLLPSIETPIKIGAVLLVIVGLLSLEWLTRKLLRLA